MNRIERQIWEETQLKELERAQRKPHGMTGARLTFIAMLVALIALFASRVPMALLYDTIVRAVVPTSVVHAPVAAPNAARDVGPSIAAPSREIADDMENAAAQDDRSIVMFEHQPRFGRHEPFVPPSLSAQTSHGEATSTIHR